MPLRSVLDQPSVDGCNTYVVSRCAAAEGLKVAVSGRVADELFDGYGHVGHAQLLERAFRATQWARPLLRKAADKPTGSARRRAAGWPVKDIKEARGNGSGHRFLPADVEALMEPATLPHWKTRSSADLERADRAPSTNSQGNTDLTNTLLRDTDAMSMANSLVRVWLLDDTIVEWVARLPDAQRLERKGLLLEAMRADVPKEILARRKQLRLPFGPWMHGPLSNDVEAAVPDPAMLADLVNPDVMWRTWQDHRRRGSRWLKVWSLYSLGKWVASLR